MVKDFIFALFGKVLWKVVFYMATYNIKWILQYIHICMYSTRNCKITLGSLFYYTFPHMHNIKISKSSSPSYTAMHLFCILQKKSRLFHLEFVSAVVWRELRSHVTNQRGGIRGFPRLSPNRELVHVGKVKKKYWQLSDTLSVLILI